MNKRLLSLLLAALLASATFTAACADSSGDKGGSSDTTTAAADTTSVADLTEMEQRALLVDDLPERNFDGVNFRISTKEGYLYEIATEEEDGEILNDALYARNIRVEDRFNVTITPVVNSAGDGNTHVNEVRKTILSADDAFDLAATYVYTSGPLVTDGLYRNWLTFEYTDLTQPWWINGVNDKFRVQDVVYTVVGDMCISTLMLTYGIFYNRSVGENYSLGDIYQDIRDGKWTIEQFISLISNIYSDVNGDGLRGDDDFYGFTAEAATNLDVYPFAFDIPIIAQDDDGIPQLVFNTEKTIKAVEIVNQLYWDGVGSYIPGDYSRPIVQFKNGGALFTTTWLANAYSTFRDMEDDYSILPYPKYDEYQENYLTGAMDNYTVLGVPTTATDLEMISIITESLNIESYKTLFPTYYEQALQNKFSRDTESIEMVDILMKGRNFDFVTLFSSNISGMPWLFRSLVASKSNSFASSYASAEKAATIGLDKVVDAYLNNSQA